ncbi:MAG: YidC/Oxa1 family membrane protein insertase [Candidatus Pacebacteria bacterium]|nr:YidC/Oxa1 family membrane protein insertase [Candidatus Paceibacterota bacterium]
MFSYIFHTFFYNPIYNGLVFLVSFFPWMDLGIAVVIVTLVVKLIVFPLTKESIKTQLKVKEIDPLVNEIRKKYEKDKETQARKIMDLYKEYKINPFASFFLILIQLPILFALYFVFLKGGLPDVNFDILYSFIKAPSHIDNVTFLGFFDITQKSLILALLAGISQFFQIRLVMAGQKKNDKPSDQNTFKDDLVKNMQLQMKYAMPVIIFIIAYGLISAVALYWITSNLFMIGQELYIRKTIKTENK